MKIVHVMVVIFVFTTLSCSKQKRSEVGASTPFGDDFTLEPVTDALAIPWGMAFLPDGSILATEKGGELFRIHDGSITSIGGVPNSKINGQGGLMDVALHPDYETNGWLYLTYSSPEGEGEGTNTALMRAKLTGNSLTDQEVLYKAAPNSDSGAHFGSRIVFDDKGYLYFSIGDRGDRDHNPQDIKRDGGKIYRLNADGTVPEDNPFVDVPDARKAIYSYGHRNPQGLTKNPFTGELWEHEHGPKGGDEINIIHSGKNYGWPKISYGINYDGTTFTDCTEMPGMEQPLFYWVPSIAPSGMVFVTSDRYPGWKGSLLVGSLSYQYLERLVLKDNKVIKREKLLNKKGRVRNVVQGPDGFIYVAIENLGIVRLIPQNK